MNHFKNLIITISLITAACRSYSQAFNNQTINESVTKIASLVKENYVFEMRIKG
ncbi:MAG: hypothetical protein HOO91_21260 [Bacteroidales bacterium]|nr:hypothetical protein [Bacteroidales bacterium]